MAKKRDLCQCMDLNCPYCRDDSPCCLDAEVTLYRIGVEGHKGTRFCTECGQYAIDGDENNPGKFTDKK